VLGHRGPQQYTGKSMSDSHARLKVMGEMIKIAFESNLVDCVCAHTLAEPNASTRVLKQCGMTKVSETVDPDVGNVWRWEISAG
jgi:[ribosomal protein S5]-alanine N-acetyltransferase